MKKLLVISYYWPPSGGVGVLRSLKFVKYLRKFNWEPVLFVPSNANYLLRDESNFKDIPDNIEIIKYPIIEPFGLYKFLSGRKRKDATDPVHVRQKVSLIDSLSIWIRGNFFIPDARCLWIKPSVKKLRNYLKDHPVDAIYTNGPPHTNTVIGLRLSSELGIPWLADFQDPWTQADYYQRYKISKWAGSRHRKLEQAVFASADKITTASLSWARDLEALGAENVDVIYYGYDEDDFRYIKQCVDSDFTIAHTGLLSSDRNPDLFFRVLRDLKSELPDFGRHLKLNFAGNIDFNVRNSIRENGLNENFNDHGFVDRPRAIQLISGAHILLLLLNKADNANGRIPGKFYEYLRAGRPILCFGPQDADLVAILKDHAAGDCVDYSQYEQIKTVIKYRYDLFVRGKNNIVSKNNGKFSVETQTKALSQHLNQITEK